MPKVIGFNQLGVKKATCHHCGAINEYRPDEVITLWSGTDYSGGPDGAEGFKCGNCTYYIITRRW